jgi:hypothetical protein
MARPWQCFSNSKPETAFKVKFLSDSSQFKHCQKKKKIRRARAASCARETDFFFHSAHELSGSLPVAKRARDTLDTVEDHPAPSPVSTAVQLKSV